MDEWSVITISHTDPSRSSKPTLVLYVRLGPHETELPGRTIPRFSCHPKTCQDGPSLRSTNLQTLPRTSLRAAMHHDLSPLKSAPSPAGTSFLPLSFSSCHTLHVCVPHGRTASGFRPQTTIGRARARLLAKSTLSTRIPSWSRGCRSYRASPLAPLQPVLRADPRPLKRWHGTGVHDERQQLEAAGSSLPGLA